MRAQRGRLLVLEARVELLERIVGEEIVPVEVRIDRRAAVELEAGVESVAAARVEARQGEVLAVIVAAASDEQRRDAELRRRHLHVRAVEQQLVAETYAEQRLARAGQLDHPAAEAAHGQAFSRGAECSDAGQHEARGSLEGVAIRRDLNLRARVHQRPFD